MWRRAAERGGGGGGGDGGEAGAAAVTWKLEAEKAAREGERWEGASRGGRRRRCARATRRCFGCGRSWRTRSATCSARR